MQTFSVSIYRTFVITRKNDFSKFLRILFLLYLLNSSRLIVSLQTENPFKYPFRYITKWNWIPVRIFTKRYLTNDFTKSEPTDTWLLFAFKWKFPNTFFTDDFHLMITNKIKHDTSSVAMRSALFRQNEKPSLNRMVSGTHCFPILGIVPQRTWTLRFHIWVVTCTLPSFQVCINKI